MMEYASADTLLYYANRQTSLSDEQHKKWTPIIEWINSRFDMELKPTEDPTGQPTISVESRKKLEQFLSFYQFPALVGIKFAAETLKSIILTIAVLSHRLTAEEAVKLARLESVYQSNIWGSFEWSHDMEHHDLSLRFSSSILFAHFSSNYYDIK
jgi:chaperone required for assembly of F1-ATPase